jgi:tRNA threonylcarbamoyladenosine biosynthesis protein TsaB
MGWRSRHTQTVELAVALAQMWQRVGVTAAAVRAIAVTVGPGSYTGLRVGLALAKGLALAHRLPLIGVGTLDVVAAAVGRREGTLLVVIQAGRRRLWAGSYQWQERPGWLPEGKPVLTTWETLLAAGAEGGSSPLLTIAGDVDQEALRLIRRSPRAAVALPAAAGTRRAGYLAEMGWQRFKRGRVDGAGHLVPLYLNEPGAAAEPQHSLG